MRKQLLSIVTVFALCAVASAQTPEEIIRNMDKAMAAGGDNGLSMVMEIKIPIVGTASSTLYILGDKARTETELMGHKMITFSDGVTEYEYDTVDNKLTIKDAKPNVNDGSEAELFSGILESYDVTLSKETDDAWYLLCKKSKNNKEKEDPDKLDLVVSKATNLPISLSTKVSGVKMVLRDVKVGVDEKLLSFNPADYPDAKIVDNRKK